MKSLIGLMGMVTLFVLSAPVRPERVSPAATPVVTSLVGAITVAQIPAWVVAGVLPLLAAHGSMIRLKAQQRVAQTFWPTWVSRFEIRTAMTALIGMCHLALQIGHDTKQLNDLRRINSASRSLLVIVNEGLKVSKIGAGKLWTELVSIKLSDLPDNLAERFCVRKHTPDRPNLRHGWVADALAFRQPQNDPWPVEKIAELFNQESGKHFDPRLVTLMLKRVPELHKNNAQYQDTE